MSASTFAFRVDASLDIGIGHVMRCLTLAASLRERGADCRFICRQLPGNLIDLIREQGFEAHVLPLELVDSEKMTLGKIARPAHAHWLCADGTTDANQTLNLLRKTPVDWLIVDHYALDVHWESALRPVCRHLMVIDDLADRPHDCDLLLDQNLGRTAADYTGLVPAHCTILAGTKYALLRPEFATLRSYSLARRSPPQFKHLLITMGGVDKNNITGQVLEALKVCRLPDDLRITVVMGPHAPWLEQVLNQVGQMLWKTEVLVNVRDMAKLMAESDLAIGAVGTTTWERCCLGLPTLALVLADNQSKSATALEMVGAIALIMNNKELAAELQVALSLLASPDRLQSMQNSCFSITDGSGVTRLSEMLINTT